LSTSLGNPFTDILILESDGTQVHASVYPEALDGTGLGVINHTVPFTPVRTLLIGLTEGTDGMGNDKTQIVMLLDNDFAAAHDGIPFSSVFPGAKHSDTIAKLKAAVGGDATQLAWFTDTFYPGPAAGAAFASSGPFSVVEFTDADVIGANAVFGNWMITKVTRISAMQGGVPTAQIEETAKTDLGPFDIEIHMDDDSIGAMIEKTVENNTGVPWTRFTVELGTGFGANFVAAMAPLAFQPGSASETSGALPDVQVSSNLIPFTGFLPAGATAHVVFQVNFGPVVAPFNFVLRQSATAGGAVGGAAPALGPEMLLALMALLGTLGALKLRRT
jgi:hypothetical protein